MAGFTGTVLTLKGRALQSKAQIGTALEFTKVKLGSGTLATGQSLENLTDLIQPVMTLAIQDMAVVGDGTSRIRANVTNESLTEGFFVREIGLYATDPMAGEILYAVANAGNYADFLPAGGGAVIVEQVLDLITVIGNAQNVTAKIDEYLTLATKQDLLDHTERKDNPHEVTAEQIPFNPIPGLAGTDLQSSLAAIFAEAKKKSTVGRNMIITGPKDTNGNPVALYSDLTSGTISLKAGTKLTFANGFDDLGNLKDIPYAVMADITKVLAAADQNTIPLRYTTDLCNGGTAISGGDYSGYTAANAFDDNSTTTWASSQNSGQSGVSYIGYKFGIGNEKMIRKVMINQIDSGNNLSSVKIQRSLDGITWLDVGTYAIVLGINYLTLPATQASQYWRILANSSLSANTWRVAEIEMYEALQTHYLYANYDNGNVNLISSKNAPRKAQQNNVIFIDGHYSSNLCTGGTAISNGDISGSPKENAFDNSMATAWGSSQTSGWAGVSYIGYDFGVGNEKMIRRIHLVQGETNYVNSAKIQGTNVLGTWNDVALVTLTLKDNVVDIPSSQKYRYWKILANSALATAPPASWYISEVEMMEYVEPQTITMNSNILHSDNLCVGGAAISSGDSSSYPKEIAFDGITNANGSYWLSALQGSAVQNSAYIGYDFGVERTVKRAVIYWGQATNTPTNCKIQYSTDGSTWNDAKTITPLASSVTTEDISITQTARYWRVLAAAPLSSGYAFTMIELQFYELSNDVYVYDCEIGKSKHYDGTIWSDVTRVYVGSADVDSSGKVVNLNCEPYNLPRIKIRDAEQENEPIALGQLVGSVGTVGKIEIPALVNGKQVTFILQWFISTTADNVFNVFPCIFPNACLHVWGNINNQSSMLSPVPSTYKKNGCNLLKRYHDGAAMTVDATIFALGY